MKNKLTKEKLEEIVKDSVSFADVCRKLNIVPIGGNYRTIKAKINLWNINIDHFTGQGWNFGEKFKSFCKSIPLNEILIENSTYTNNNLLKNKLFKAGLKEKKCECCGIINWNNCELSFELHHKNGNNLDNRVENLLIVCPNCHSQMPHFRGNNKKSEKNKLRKANFEKYNELQLNKEIKSKSQSKKKYYCSCGNEISSRSKQCLSCRNLNNRKVIRPDYNILLDDIKNLGYVGTGNKYGVSDNAIRKWINNGHVVELANTSD